MKLGMEREPDRQVGGYCLLGNKSKPSFVKFLVRAGNQEEEAI